MRPAAGAAGHDAAAEQRGVSASCVRAGRADFRAGRENQGVNVSADLSEEVQGGREGEGCS